MTENNTEPEKKGNRAVKRASSGSFNLREKKQQLYSELTKGNITTFDFIVEMEKLDKEFIKKTLFIVLADNLTNKEKYDKINKLSGGL